MPWHRLGTVSVTLNSSTVTGVGTGFAANSRIGDAFIGPDGRQYELANVASDTVISITPTYQGPTVSGAAYAIVPIQGYSKGLADQVRDWVNNYGPKMAALGTTGNYDVLPVAKGGTGSTNAAAARLALLAAEQTLGFIEGLSLYWNSGLSITVRPGSAYVPGLGRVVSYAGGTITPTTVGAVNTFLHLYLTDTGTIETSTTAPARYYNTAHVKTGDNYRRYIGSILINTNAAGAYQFVHHPLDNSIMYTLANPQASPFVALSGGAAAAAFTTRVVAPPTAHTLEAAWQNTGTVPAQFTPSDAGTAIGNGWVVFVMPGAIFNGRCPIATDGTITYKASGGGSASCYALGYYFDR
ncbi:hypothetical protein [Pseudomonas fluorescens]|uniref:Uncharacterized protein n=1 Tax=Pseudomonas fluorescens TaxID=294 RepID=A0A5E7N7K2_PSEFL|nr:hypothetical protein [Pseudomonas fluorescens]VVP33131.1 hypothetical protein PS880_04445 [Pseudomonas fluorescens]